jgi:SAM-dependent methyltransferase
MDRAALRAGEDVLDVGCGCGETTVELARRVAPGGTVLGVDVSAVMLERARQTARERGAAARFQLADAQTHAFAPASVDVVFSRFGVMFFVDPAAAFANLRRALRPQGRLAFVCWQSLADNPWMLVPLGAALQIVPPPPLPAPDAPGPFAFADPARVRGILERAGFRDVQLDAVQAELTVGGGAGLDETVDFLLQMGPTSALLRDSTDPGLQPRLAAAVREALRPYQTPQGVRMGSASWIVSARA